MTIRRRRSISDPSWLLDDFEGMVFSGLEHACLYCTVRIEFPNVVLEHPHRCWTAIDARDMSRRDT